MNLDTHLGSKDQTHGHMIVTPAQMALVDQRTIAAGTPGLTLMQRAGAAVVRVIRSTWSPRAVAVLAGPGNNGGDGWVIAQHLHQCGWPVHVFSDWTAATLKGGAQSAAALAVDAGVPFAPLASFSEDARAALIVDALLGAGLTRLVDGAMATALAGARERGLPSVAVDLPSGVDGATGVVLGHGPALCAACTVTFGAPKPGHFLGEGRRLTGDLHIADIGLALEASDAAAQVNTPTPQWAARLKGPNGDAHKYQRGSVLVIGGSRHAGGAARLAAEAAARAGAGVVTIGAEGSALDAYTPHLGAIMLKRIEDGAALTTFLEGSKVDVIVIGPGLGLGEREAALTKVALQSGKTCIVDADSITLLAADPSLGAAGDAARWVLTPHEGEFKRLFPTLAGDALTRAQAAADHSGATVLLKGATTVIARTGEVPRVNIHAAPSLATAGSGDVLAGTIAGLAAPRFGNSPFDAACIGAWLHGDAGQRLGIGLTADDLPKGIALARRALAGKD